MDYKKFFERKTQDVAQELLGRIVVRKLESGIFAAEITETGAYVGLGNDVHEDARKGMFYTAGHIFLMPFRGSQLFNIASGAGSPACVEIREVCGERRVAGSGAIANFLKLTANMNNMPLGEKSGVYISDDSYRTGKVSRSEGQADNCKGFYSFA